MGDRCNCTVHVRRDDLERVMPDWEEELGFEYKHETDGVLMLEFAEVNYANMENEGLPTNIPCIIENSAGCEYEAGTRVQDPEADPSVCNCNKWCTDGCEGFVFGIGDNGLPIVTDAWRKFWALYQKVKKHLEAPPAVETDPLKQAVRDLIAHDKAEGIFDEAEDTFEEGDKIFGGGAIKSDKLGAILRKLEELTR